MLFLIAFYGRLDYLVLIPKDSPLFHFFTDLGDGHINGNTLCFFGVILIIVILWLISREIVLGPIHIEPAKVDSTRTKHASEYRFFE